MSAASPAKAAQNASRGAAAEITEALQADLTWQADAACKDVPASTSAAMAGTMTPADAEVTSWICGGCTVAWECIGEGLRTRADGVWGGFVLRNGREVAA